MGAIKPDSFRGFFTITPPDSVRDQLLASSHHLQSESWAPQVRWSPAENLHLTVRFMGSRTLHDYVVWLGALRPVLATMKPFEVRIEQIELFPNQRKPVAIAALVPTTPELEALVGQVEAVVQSRALPERHDYRGHFTLGRCKRGFDRHTEIVHAPLNVTMPVTSLGLYRSDMHPDGVRYTRMAELPLGESK